MVASKYVSFQPLGRLRQESDEVETTLGYVSKILNRRKIKEKPGLMTWVCNISYLGEAEAGGSHIFPAELQSV